MEPKRSTPTISETPRSGKGGKLRAVGVAIGLTITTLICSILLSLLIAISLFQLELGGGSTLSIGLLTIGGYIGFFTVGYLYIRRYKFNVPINLPGRRELRTAAGGVVVAFMFAAGALAVYSWAGILPGYAFEEIIAQDPIIAIWLAILSIIVVAPAEEYLFRGVIQGRLRKTFSAPGAIIGASLLFGSLHLANYTGTLGIVVGWSLIIVGIGVIFGVLYERTKNLTVPIIAHAVYNFIVFTMAYLML